MMLLKRHATVTICHTRTKDLTATCREAEILVAAAGKARMVTADMVGDGAVVVDVGINVDDKGNLCGDVDFEAAEPATSYISRCQEALEASLPPCWQNMCLKRRNICLWKDDVLG